MSESGETKPAEISRARRAGQIMQGLVVGPALVLALIKLVSVAGNLTPFKYQGF